MKLWAIPVSWEVAGIAMIPGNTLDEAIQAVKHDESIGLPSGEYVDGSFDVTVDDEVLIREFYNHGQQDEIDADGGELDGL